MPPCRRSAGRRARSVIAGVENGTGGACRPTTGCASRRASRAKRRRRDASGKRGRQTRRRRCAGSSCCRSCFAPSSARLNRGNTGPAYGVIRHTCDPPGMRTQSDAGCGSRPWHD
ncbi:conserved hypothetical protein [Burkholderia multivorans CGD2M]|nr:conserved hypothetical protein [Burkholderia multivorans CGD2M]